MFPVPHTDQERAVPGSGQAWASASERERRRTVRLLVRGERNRAQFEAFLKADAEAERAWRDFPVTEQRELLGTIGYWLPKWMPKGWEIRRLVKVVMAGSEYRRRETS